MVTAARPKNPAPRVTECHGCGRRIEAGRRGPLPQRCDDCKAGNQAALAYRIATARKTALEYDRPDIAQRLDDIGELVVQGWTRLGE